MLAQPITYEDLFTGEKVTKTFYFHLTKAELIELEKSIDGGLSDLIKRIIEAHENEKLIPLFKKLVEISYGERTEHGSFRKTKEATQEFLASEAYSELFMSFFDAENAANFIKGIMPKEVVEELDKKFPNGILDTESALKEINQIKEENKVNASVNNNSTK